MPQHTAAHHSEVVVLGAGLAGLTAATELARRGHSVVVVEKAKQLGGRAMTQDEKGYSWNLGAHALYRRGRAARILGELGVRFTGNMPSASGQFAVDGGRPHTLPTGFVSLLSTGLLPLGGKLELARLLMALQRVDPEPLRDVTVAAWLGERMKHEEVRAFLRALVRLTTYCNAPELMSAGDAVEQLRMAVASNVLYLDGGWQTLIDGLAELARGHGVRIEHGCAARELEVSGAVSSVKLADGRKITCDAVVAAVPPHALLALLGDAAPADFRRVADALVPVRAACLDLALTDLPVAQATFALGVDEPLYLSVHSAVANLAPRGGAVVHMLKYLSPDRQHDPAADEHTLEKLIDLLQPGWRRRTVARRFLPAMIVTHALPLASAGGKAGRPSADCVGIEGVFVAGDWVGSHGLLADGAVASARAAAEHCHAHLGRRAAKAA